MADFSHLLAAAKDLENAETPSSITALIAHMRNLENILDTLKGQTKSIQALYDSVRKSALPDAMTEAGLQNVKLADGGSVYLRKDVHANVSGEDKDTLIAWLRDNGHGSLVVPTVNLQTLKAFVKELSAAGAPLPPMVQTHQEIVAVLRKT